jgi:hypothetical protein
VINVPKDGSPVYVVICNGLPIQITAKAYATFFRDSPVLYGAEPYTYEMALSVAVMHEFARQLELMLRQDRPDYPPHLRRE